MIYLLLTVFFALSTLFLLWYTAALRRKLINHEKLVYIDELTGLPNRKALYDFLAHETARAQRNNTKIAVAFIDLDGFKIVNDRSGHHVGDELLAAVAKKMQSSIREYDTLCRFGGDEFVAIFPEIKGIQDTSRIGEKIITAANEAIVVSTEQPVGASVGIALYPEDDTDPDELLRKADNAMYAAKAAGKNRICLWSERVKTIEAAGQPKAKRSMLMALQNNEVELWYQPQRDIETLAIVGVEALIRWNHPELGIIGPSEFMPLIEHAGLSDAYAQRVVELICLHTKTMHEKFTFHKPPKLWMNISPSQLISKRQDIVSVLVQTAAHFGVLPESIGVEMTEERFMADSSLFSKRLMQIKKHGFSVAIDDFGVGRFSMMDLKNQAFDKVKIDKSLVRHIEDDERQRLIMTAIVNMAKTIGYSVTAEGVETDTEYDHVKEIGVDEIQGFIFDRPMPFQELVELLT